MTLLSAPRPSRRRRVATLLGCALGTGLLLGTLPTHAQDVASPFPPPTPPDRPSAAAAAEGGEAFRFETPPGDDGVPPSPWLARIGSLMLNPSEQTDPGLAGLEAIEPAGMPVMGAILEIGRTLSARPLGALSRSSDNLQLTGPFDRLDIDLPITPGADIDRLGLELVWRSSDQLAPDDSRLWLYLNGTPVAELPMGGAAESLTAKVDLPVGLVRDGANTVSLVSRQAHVAGCVPQATDALWTQLDPNNSYLVVEGEPVPVRPTLAQLEEPAGPLRASHTPVRIAVAGQLEDLSNLRLGAWVTAGLALRAGDRPLRVVPTTLEDFSLAPRVLTAAGGPEASLMGRAGSMVVLVGEAERLRPVLGGEVDRIDGPYLGRHDLAVPEAAAVLVVSGRTAEQVAQAARSLASARMALPDSARVSLDRPVGTTVPLDRPTVAPGSTVTFGDLPMNARNIDGWGERTEVVLDLPADIFVDANQRVRMNLAYEYPAGLPEGAILNVLLNGRSIGAAPMDDPDGARVDGRLITFPARLMRPGSNTLAFEPANSRNDAENCAWQPLDGAAIAVLPETEIDLPELTRITRLPDLHLTASTGSPMVGQPRSGATLAAVATDDDSVAALWTVVGRLAQVSGSPAIADTVGALPRRPTGHLLVVGRADGLVATGLLEDAPPALASVVQRLGREAERTGPGTGPLRTPPSLDRPQTAPSGPATAPIAGRDRDAASGERPPALAAMLTTRGLDDGGVVEGIVAGLTSVGRWLERQAEPLMFWRPTLEPDRIGQPGHNAVVAAFPRSDRSGTTNLLTASSGPLLRLAAHELVSPARWNQLDGDAVTWEVGFESMTTARVAEPIFVSDERGLPARLKFIDSLLANQPGLWFILSLLVIGVFGGLSWLALRNRTVQ